MPKGKFFHFRLDIQRYSSEIITRPDDAELGSWFRAHFLHLATGSGKDELAAEMISEAESFSQKRAEAAKTRWDRKASAMQTDASALQRVASEMQTQCNAMPIAEAEAEAKAKAKESALVVVGGAGGDSRALPAKRTKVIEERQQEFGATLQQFLGQYGRETLGAFYRYWTEPNKSRTKLRFELERTWELERRLQTWASREKPQAAGGSRGAHNLEEVKAFLQQQGAE